MTETSAEVQYELQLGTPEPPTDKRRILTLADRIKVIDYLRSLFEPIIGTRAEIIAVITNETGVTISWSQLSYMIDDLEEYKLGEKIRVPLPKQPINEIEVAAISARLNALQERVADLEALIARSIAIDSR